MDGTDAANWDPTFPYSDLSIGPVLSNTTSDEYRLHTGERCDGGRSQRAGLCKRVTVDRDWEGSFAWNPIRMESRRKSEDVILARSRSPPYPSLPSACRSQSRNVTNAIWQRTGKSQANFLFPCNSHRLSSFLHSFNLISKSCPLWASASDHEV